MSESLEVFFSPDGPLSSVLGSYCYRDSQIEMALDIEKAFDNGTVAVIEAGTGTGKSFAYLVPAIRRLMSDRSAKVVVATSTITLQKQLFEKDIPLLVSAMNFTENIAILYGRSNYACIRRFKDLEEQSSLIALDEDGELKRFSKWIKSTTTGEKTDLGDRKLVDFFQNVCSDENDCKGRKCPYINECFYYKARNDALKARLVVTNHHIFLIDGKHRQECSIDFTENAILPSYDYAILDEAHHLDAEATEILSRNYCFDDLKAVLDFLTKKDARLFDLSLIEYLSKYEKSHGIGKEALSRIRDLRKTSQSFDERLTVILSNFPGSEVLLTPEAFQLVRPVLQEAEALAKDIADLYVVLSTMIDGEVAEEDAQHAQNLFRQSEVLLFLADNLRDMIRFSDFENQIPYAQRNNGARYELKISPMNVGEMMKTIFYDNLKSIVFCSATLSVSKNFEYFKSEIGLSDRSIVEGSFESPFLYKKNLMLLLPLDGKQYRNEASQEYMTYTSTVITEAICHSGGGALVLFTSKKMLEEVFYIVRENLKGHEIYCQGISGSRNTLLNTFKKHVDSSLFATSSFWEGVDAPGNTLRLVIIVKLPFTVPTTPIYQARCRHLDEKGSSSFMSITVPEAAIKLKQGLGRLIRSEEDRGVVLILDNRILAKNYGRTLLSSLPECYVPEDCMLSNIGSKIENFLY